MSEGSYVAATVPEAAYDADGVDRSLIRWMLGLTPTERLRHVQGEIDLVRRQALAEWRSLISFEPSSPTTSGSSSSEVWRRLEAFRTATLGPADRDAPRWSRERQHAHALRARCRTPRDAERRAGEFDSGRPLPFALPARIKTSRKPARPVGFEPTTLGFEVRCSIQLS